MVYDGKGYANGFVYAFQGGHQRVLALQAEQRHHRSMDARGQRALDRRRRRRADRARAVHLRAAGRQSDRLRALRHQQQYVDRRWPRCRQRRETARALATDGTYIYALRGGDKNNFYRYNVATNTWTPMAELSLGARTRAAR